MKKISKMITKKDIIIAIIMMIIFYIVHRTFGEPNYYLFVFGCLIGGLETIIMFND